MNMYGSQPGGIYGSLPGVYGSGYGMPATTGVTMPMQQQYQDNGIER
eukprot:CAMPEP_0173389904 /NCGR_PEP_ID=MMETSP1356-20130122/13941_1 /TAXON_ID=77927 ORGANISM="Hemiselmis virescens, Strain PCC157" /NCGR_SAMPLE_ID=MMETSP1356 /ASSEMBLY_ACC=CAM_ASM_000847 /LENGTH=46 /DNA_ID= /DNA_START= /DNA_END= /DNA_ORIENTATION=